jgi:basic membrane protein A
MPVPIRPAGPGAQPVRPSTTAAGETRPGKPEGEIAVRTRRGILSTVALASTFALVAAACGGDDGDSAEDTTTTTAAATTTTAAATTTTAGGGGGGATGEGKSVGLLFDITGRGDKSFNDSAAAGLDKARADFPDIEATESVPTSDGDRAQRLNLMAQQGTGLIIGVGFLWGDAVKAGCEANPDLSFAIVDSVIDGCEKNAAGLVFAEQEGSFLVGAAAALKSENGHVGFIGGMEIDLIKRFEAGFIAGAKAVNPDIKIDSSYLGPAGDATAFNNPAKAKETALSFYQGGADVVYHAAGASGNGLFEAAAEFSEQEGSKVWAIGVDSDQYLVVGEELQEYVLTSMLKRVDVAVYETIKAHVEGTFAGGVRVFDLKSGGVGYSTTGGFVDDIKADLDKFAEQIISGAIKVPTNPADA